MKQITLSKGLFALVDDEDFESLNALKWHAHKCANTYYARRNLPRKDGKRTSLTMHEMITGLKKPDHKDGNGLNNQRSNLRPANPQQQAQNRGKRKDSTSQYKGVAKYGTKENPKYLAYVQVGGFTSEIEAARMADRLATTASGEYARLNFPVGV